MSPPTFKDVAPPLTQTVRQIVNYLGQVSTEVKGLVYYCYRVFAVRFCIFGEQSIDYSTSDKNLALLRVEAWTVAALKKYVKKRGLPVIMG